MNTKEILENKVVLYVVLFFAVTNFFGYLLLNNYNAAIFMAVVGFVASQFSKNMIIVLGASIVVTSMFVGSQTVQEGMANEEDEKEGMTHGGGGGKQEGKEDKKEDNQKDKNEDKKEKFQPSLSPKVIEEDKEEDDYKPQSEKLQKRMKAEGPNAIDESATIEAAYKNLDKLLGSDGVASMSKESNSILANQNQLMKNLENLEPMVNKAHSMIEGLQNSGTLDKLEGMISKFGGGKLNKL